MRHDIVFGDGEADVTVRTFGVADREGFFAFNRELVDHPRYVPGMSVLLDHSELDMTLLSVADLDAVGAFVADLEERVGDGPVAIVAPDAFTFGLLSASVDVAQLQALSPRTFATREEAERWLAEQRAAG